MFNKEQLDNLLNTPVSRRQFLAYVGAVLTSLIGLTSFLDNLDKFAQKSNVSDANHGWSAYSGASGQNNHIVNLMNKLVGKI